MGRTVPRSAGARFSGSTCGFTMTPALGGSTSPGQTTAIRTFLIADIRGYTRFTQERGDEAAARLAATFAEIVQEGVEAGGGQLVELRGDEALAVFASARRAIQAAIGLQEVLDLEVDERPSLRLGVGMGLDAGEAVPVADGYRGGALNLAARLCARADAGEILASQGVVHLARTLEGIRFEPLEPLELKGIAQPVQAVRVVADRPATRRPRPPPTRRAELSPGLDPSSPLVGRETELRWLRWSWRRVLHGHGRVVSLGGPSGIGKTRLAAELGREVHASGWPVLHARCAGPAPAALAALRQAQSAAAPTLVVADDLDLATGTVLDTLDALLEQVPTSPIMVLGTHRDDTRSPLVSPRFERAATGPEHRRRLEPLGAEAVRQIASLYLRRAGRPLPVDALLEQTDGVPLLVHRWVSEWARKDTTDRLSASANQFASGRRGLRVAEAELASNVIDLQFADERRHLYLVDEPEAAAGTVACPFKGLARFEPSDAEYFFGRERLVAELVTHLVGAGLVGVVGPSGSGKSSLIRAGLLPAVRDGVLPGSDRWRQLIIRPGEHPMRELGPALGAGEERLLLAVDQFEEVFTACRDEDERAAFLASLVELAHVSDGRATVVVCVRADYYGHCAADPGLAGLLAANHVLVGPMSAEELRRAIELPARRAGLQLEPGLAEAMIAEVAQEPGGLPLLSCALLESWERRRGRTLTLAAYQQAGGVRGAVARLAERAWRQLDPDEQAVARRVLLRLTGPGEGDAVVRRRVPLSEFAAGDDERGRLVLDALANQRLLSMGEDGVEVAHEALLREWPRLRGWLEEDVQGRMLHRHLIGAAQAWEQAGHDPGELYRGARLTAALDWAHSHHEDLNELERAFLDASRAAAEQDMADARRRAEQEARTSRRLRGLLAGLAAVLVVALVAGGLALAQRGRAERQALVADAGRLGALALTEDRLDRSVLLARQAVALDDSLETRGDLLAALLRSPAATEIMRPGLDGINPLDLSPDGRLLAMGDGAGRVEVFDIRTRRPIPGDIRSGTPINDLAFSPDGSLLAVATGPGGGLVQLWDVRTTTLRHQLRTAIYAGVVQFSADGQTLVTLSADEADTPSGFGNNFLTRWDVDTGRRLKGPVRISSHGGETLITTPDGARLVALSDAEAVVVAANTLQPVRRVPRTPERGLAALRPTDGRTLALGLDTGAVELLDLSTGRQRTLGRHATSVLAVEFSPDGATLATGSTDGKVMIWDVASGQVRETFEGHEGRIGIRGLRFTSQGRTLYSTGPSSVIAWDVEGSDRLGRRFSFSTTPTSPTFAVSPDGSILATPDGKRSDHIALRDLRSLKQTRRPLAPGIGPLSAIAFGPDGKHLAVGGEQADSAPVLVDVASGKVTRRMTGGHDDGFQSVAFDPKGQRLLTGGHDRRAIVWEVETGKQLLDLRHPGDDDLNETAVAWSPDGTMVATAGGDGLVALWRVPDGKQVATFKADPVWVPSVAFSPDGSLIAAGGSIDKQVTLWDLNTHKLVGRLPHPTILARLAFDPGGKTLATVTIHGTARLWDVASRRQIGLALPGPSVFANVGFDPNGNRLVTLYEDGTGVVWDVDPDHWRQRACSVASRSLTREEWAELLPGRSYQPACR
jgi:WD40 repeat protein/class 3 adenylate cyclase